MLARLLCTSKATAAAVHQHTAGHLQQLQLSLKDLQQTEQFEAVGCQSTLARHSGRAVNH
jgi:hypothetical protein